MLFRFCVGRYNRICGLVLGIAVGFVFFVVCVGAGLLVSQGLCWFLQHRVLHGVLPRFMFVL